MKPPIQSRTDLATWIESCVLGDLRTLLAGVDTYYASPSHLSIDGRRRKKLIEMVMEGVPPSKVKDELTANAARREAL